MADKLRVLFVCAKNDVRSVLAEALLRHADSQHFEAFSAGLTASQVDPRALEALEHIGIETAGLRSKSIVEVDEEQFHYVVTLCDKSSEEVGGIPNADEVIVWNFADPTVSEKAEPFRHALQEIHDRINMFVTVKIRNLHGDGGEGPAPVV